MWSWFLVLFVIALIGLVVFGSVSYNNALPRVRLGQADRELKVIPLYRAISGGRSDNLPKDIGTYCGRDGKG